MSKTPTKRAISRKIRKGIRSAGFEVIPDSNSDKGIEVVANTAARAIRSGQKTANDVRGQVSNLFDKARRKIHEATKPQRRQ